MKHKWQKIRGGFSLVEMLVVIAVILIVVTMMLKVASGQRTKSEELGYGDNEYVPWHIGATM